MPTATFNPPMSVGEFIDNFDLVMRCNPTRATKRQAGTEWGRSASHWVCIFRVNVLGQRSRRFLTRFSRGSAYHGAPPIEEVFGYMVRDYGALEGRDFDAWRAETGWDDPEDLNNARRIFDAVSRDAKLFREFIGEDAYAEFLTVDPGN